MLGTVRIALASCLWLPLVACSETAGSEPYPAGGGAPGISAGSPDPGAGSTAAGSGGNASSEVGGGAGRANVAGSGGGLSAGGTAGAGGAHPIGMQAILDSYRSFEPQTAAPVSVSAYLFGLCRMPTLRETEFLDSIHGDGRYLQDWANPLAEQGIATRGAPAFPVGAVIVKEKYAGLQATQAELVAIGLMIKREAGFDSAHGDWDYAYYEPALGVVQTAEQTAYCSKCHAGAASTDFVYVDGLKP